LLSKRSVSLSYAFPPEKIHGLLSPLGVLLLDLTEEVGQLLIAFFLSILDVLRVERPSLGSVVEHAREVVVVIADSGELFAFSGHFSTS
jgi:hypothetical protein